MQLWEFTRLLLQVLDKITEVSFNQNAAKTARQMVVVVARNL
jgi:hypothetical protein